VSGAIATVDGVAVTHPDRVVYPDDDLSKLDVVRYYDAVAEHMVAHLRGRPLTLVACPGGLGKGCQYLRHSKIWGSKLVRRVRIREKTKTGEYMIVDTREALLSLAQFNIIELHTWNADFDTDVEKPNRIVFDLDPGEEVGWRQVIACATLVRDVLAALQLKSWAKTTGGRGLHVVAPIRPEQPWSECLAFAKAIAEILVTQEYDLYTTNFKKAGRERKILIDYLRNNRTNTTIAAFSLRARRGAPISMPISWADLVPSKRPDRFTLTRVTRASRADPWRNYWRCDQRLTKDMLNAVRS
jgi:bifunctional non-homologous end joining protein LigD